MNPWPPQPVPGAGEQPVVDFIVTLPLGPQGRRQVLTVIELSMIAPMSCAADLAERHEIPLSTAYRWWKRARGALGFDLAELHDRLRPYPNVLGAALRLSQP